MDNILKTIDKSNLNGFGWLKPPVSFETRDGALFITPERKSDFFFSPIDPVDRFNAAALLRKVKGNFVAVACVEPDLSSRANAAGLLGYFDKDHWAKLCFERTGPDSLGPCAMVNTIYRSDDANGETLKNNPKSLWLKYCRCGFAFSMFYSQDGINYTFLRKYALPGFPDEMSVGVFAQCPDCGPKQHKITFLSIESVESVNIRTGVIEKKG
ncbi:MAG: DUF1349 domain-containing protein [Bacillota bacterium]|nr:DUF1349 domain-containing protein [Bacillota bacterium]